MKILAIIPARGGSKGIPKKNIIPLCGKPLIQYTIEAAKKSRSIDRIFLSSDSDEIISVAKKLGLESEYIRPPHLADDHSSTADAIMDLLIWLEEKEKYIPDAILLLQPTSPLRCSQDIDDAIELFRVKNQDCLVSVHEMIEHPYECVTDIGTNNWSYLSKPEIHASRRQDYQKKFYFINGAIYLVNADFFKRYKTFIQEENTTFYIMPHEKGIDIDAHNDLKKAEFFLTKV